MEEVESYQLVLLIKQLKLAVKFPCRLTLQHSGIPISQQIQSNGSNVFTVNKQVNIKQEKQKDYTEININLATDKGGNIMAGIIKINLKDISSSQGDSLTVSLQKCLDPYATCLLTVKSVKINRSRVKKGLLDDRKQKYDPTRFQTKSEAMIMDPGKNIKSRPRYNEAESFVQKRVNFSNIQSQGNSNLKEKALSMAGFKGLNGLNTSFERQQLGTRFKHLNKKEEDSKTVITGKWRDPEQSIKSSIEANQKSLKLEIIKFKTKYQETERNLQQKVKQNKNLKDQISELNRQLSQKQYIIEQNNSKNTQIAKLQQANKTLSKQITEQKNKVIDLQRQIQQERNGNFMQMSRYKQEHQKKEYEFQKHIYEKKQEIKEIVEENQYKINQINKMKALIQDLERSLDVKTYQFQKTYSNERNEHNKTKAASQQKQNQLSAQIKRLETLNQETNNSLKKAEEQLFKLQKRSMYLQQSLLQREKSFEDQCLAREKLNEQKKRLQKNEQELNSKLKNIQKTLCEKQKEFDQVNIQLNEVSTSSKKKISEVLQKNKAYTAKIQELQNKVNVLSMQEEKMKRNIDMAQKQMKVLQQNQKVLSKNIKLKDDRILQLQKEISDYQNKNSMKEGLFKKQTQYKTLQLEKLTLRVSQLEKSYQKQKEISQQRRLDLLKNENKLKMLEQTNNRLNEQIKQLKLIQIKKDDQWNEKLKQLKENIKELQGKQAQYNKTIHGYQIEKINLKNQIGKFEKLSQSQQQKFDRLKKRQSEMESFIKSLQNEIQIKNEEIVETEANYKQLQNSYKSLQADKSKTQKITTIINEEKDLVKNDVNRLKKQIERRQQKQEQYLNEIKGLKQQITKLQIKCSTTSKQYEKFKTSMSQTIKNSLNIKNSYTSIENFSPLDRSRDMGRSRLKHSRDLTTSFQSGQSRFGETIENFAKQSQQIVMVLNQELKRVRREKQQIEKQFANLNNKLKQTEEERSKQIKEVNNEVQILNDQYTSEIEQYEEKIISLQKQLHQKEKEYNLLLEDYNQLKGIHHNSDVANEMTISQLQTKINSLKNKITEWERKDQNNSQMFVNLQQKIVMLQSQNTELNHQNQVISDHLSKKQKLCSQYKEKNQDLVEELENLKKIKSELNAELMGVKQNYSVEKESNRQLLLQIKQEQQKNNQLKALNNEFLKEKEQMIKRQFEKTEKINSIQQKLQIYMIEIAQKNQQLGKKDKICSENKDSIKLLQVQNTNSQNSISDLKLSLQRERQKIKQKQKKIVEKQSQIQTLNSHVKKITTKFESRIQKLTQQNEGLNEQLSKQKEQNSTKVNEYQIQIKKYKQNQKKLNQNNISLEQQIFFEKQTNSLNSAKIDEIKQQIVDINIEKEELTNEISNLNQQLRQKEESLFALSGKLYASDNRLQSKEDQFKMRLQKVDLEWRYKVQQICEEYENKLQMMEREKNIARNGAQSYNQTVQKLQNDKINMQYEFEKEKQSWELKLKKVEEEKLASLIQKNKQIERLRQVFEQLEQKMKRKDFQCKTLEQDKKKGEEKLKELRAEIEKSQDKKGQKIYNLQKEIDQLKRKEGQLKRFKQALKNNQWATQRQIKKNLQLCSKGVTALARQQNKDQVVNLMRNLQTSITKLAFQNINQL